MTKNTITCFLCGGVHIYPGPRFGDHLLHEHGIVFNQEYIMSVSEYKDTYATLPPITPNIPCSSLNQFTQTDGLGDFNGSIICNCEKPFTGVPSLSPIRNAIPSIVTSLASNNQSPGPFSTSTPKAASMHPLYPKSSGLSSVKQENFLQSLQQDEEFVVPERSGYIFKCALCDLVTKYDSSFWDHITKKHKMTYGAYKDQYGNCATPIGSGKFECGICQSIIKHFPGNVLKHMKFKHGITWQAYIDTLFSERHKVKVKTEIMDTSQHSIGASRYPDSSGLDIKKLSDTGEQSQPLVVGDEICKESPRGQVAEVDSMGRHFKCNSALQLNDSHTEAILAANIAARVKVETDTDTETKSGVADIGEKFQRGSKCRPLNIKDKNTKYCSKCGQSFTTRILFLKHCQEVHKLRLKNKFGKPIVLSKSMPAGDKSKHMCESTKASVPKSLTSYSAEPASSYPPNSKTEHSCQYCHKVFSSLSNMWRHVKLSCKMREDQQVIHVPVKPVEGSSEGGGFDCKKCGKIFAKLGNLNRHLIDLSNCNV